VNHRFVSISYCLLFIIANVFWLGGIAVVTSITPDTSLTATSYSEEEYRCGVFPPGNPVDQFQSAIDLGITQPRVILSWNLFEPSKGQFKFMLYDWNIYKMHQERLH
jgi:beta-galactosidase GanA